MRVCPLNFSLSLDSKAKLTLRNDYDAASVNGAMQTRLGGLDVKTPRWKDRSNRVKSYDAGLG